MSIEILGIDYAKNMPNFYFEPVERSKIIKKCSV